MGSEAFVRSHEAEWEKTLKNKGVEVEVVHIPKGSRFPALSDWGRKREVYWETHDKCPEK